MSATVVLPNTGDLRRVEADGDLVVYGDTVYLEKHEAIEGAVEGEDQTATSSVSLAALLRTAYGADEALAAEMGVETTDATEARVGLGAVRVTIEFV